MEPTGSAAVLGPLKLSTKNPRYFVDGDEREILLVGSHTWFSLVDRGIGNPPPAFDFDAYLDFLQRHGHNFIRLWAVEHARWELALDNDGIRARPQSYKRTGPGIALDGLPKFDLEQFDPEYFNRLRSRVEAAARRGIYVSVMLFNGWSVAKSKGDFARSNPWRGHPFHRSNNVNGIDGDPNGDESGLEVHTLASPEVTAIQDRYVRHVIDTVNGFDNVLYEISNESDQSSLDWQAHVVRLIKEYEAGKPKRHPVGMTAMWPGGRNDDLRASAADWISPNGDVTSRPPNDGRKVVLVDTDHLCAVCGDRGWVWKSFTSGENPIFMDPYGFPPTPGVDLPWQLNDRLLMDVRTHLGYARALSTRIDLATMLPRPDLASSGYCLARTDMQAPEYVAYVDRSARVELDLRDATGSLRSEWLDPATGRWVPGASVHGGGRARLVSPTQGDTVVRLHR